MPDERPIPAGSIDASEFARRLGLTVTSASGDQVAAYLDLEPSHHTPAGIVHGGVYATIVETVASIGASLAVRPEGKIAVGLHNSTDFLRPMSLGRIEAVAVPITKGRTQQLWRVSITRAGDDKLVAIGQLRLQNVPADAFEGTDSAVADPPTGATDSGQP